MTNEIITGWTMLSVGLIGLILCAYEFIKLRIIRNKIDSGEIKTRKDLSEFLNGH